MYCRIFLAYDGTQIGQQALLKSPEIQQWPGAKFKLAAVIFADSENSSRGIEYLPAFHLSRKNRKEHQLILNFGVSDLLSRGLRTSGLLLIGDTVSEIANHAKEMQSDLIVVGHCLQKNWKRRWWSLETSKSLVEAVHCSVLVVGL